MCIPVNIDIVLLGRRPCDTSRARCKHPSRTKTPAPLASQTRQRLSCVMFAKMRSGTTSMGASYEGGMFCFSRGLSISGTPQHASPIRRDRPTLHGRRNTYFHMGSEVKSMWVDRSMYRSTTCHAICVAFLSRRSSEQTSTSGRRRRRQGGRQGDLDRAGRQLN
ncbi:uncharacterized protein K489DRAFT_381593 [Dissoconium aciculare CBS 342.82]|uniref:Uncharacterized protein n=1 Tax=Dissoconium aciculare CBS 342.82 TaxID=1314786 RepID=A0A6J3M0Q1_9PEZI|nr:uncharacterized protein K489DRAFT_381593 [Dissoconium aciculare CBS 342.82]KAF1821601.1 hypothetical protein K489DRAFT_381593 [Dissoconium aciculare CBS 342.82]